MSMSVLAHLLTAELGEEAGPLLARARAETGVEDPSAWLDWLVQMRLLTPGRRAAVFAAFAAGGGRTELSAERPPTLRPPPEVAVARPSLAPRPTRPADEPPSESRLDFGEVLGRGAMGCVYRATDVALGRDVAFKQLSDARAQDVRDRFVREARLTAQLDHPHIVPVHWFETSPTDGTPGYAMRLVAGRTLAQVLREAADRAQAGGPQDAAHAPATLLDHFLKVCDAIAFAHSRGILHRDLKPANIMVGAFGEVYVMDWGVSRLMGASDDTTLAPEAPTPTPGAADPDGASLTRVGQIVGTPRYMSPEQARGWNHLLDGRSDQYTLGVILFEIVTLRRAVPGETGQAALASAAEGRMVALEHVVPGRSVPRELAAIIRRATARGPEDRYPSVTALADDVRRHLRGEAVLASPDSAPQRVLRWVGRHREVTVAIALAGLALATAAGGVAVYREGKAEQARAEAERRSAAAEVAERERGARRTAYLGRVAEQAHRIDGEFVKLERALEGLRTAAVWALTGPEPPPEAAPLYFDEDFADEARRPPDFGRTAYRWPVSLEHPVVGLAPEAKLRKAELLPALRRLSPLRHHMRRMFVEAATGGHEAFGDDKVRRILAERRGAIDYAYVCLPAGVHFMLPGMDALPPGYDVRTAGFYQISDHQHGKRWGAPYIDSTTDAAGDDLVLPCTEGLWSPAGEFLGVAGVEITVTKMVDTALRIEGLATVRQSLLRADGRKVIDTFDAGKRFPNASGKDEALALSDFDVPDVVAAVKAGGSGILDVERTVDGHPTRLVAAYVPLDVLDWYYVVEATAEAVEGGVKRP